MNNLTLIVLLIECNNDKVEWHSVTFPHVRKSTTKKWTITLSSF